MLSPPAAEQTSWTKTILYQFLADNDGQSPAAELVVDSSGALYGVTPAGNGSAQYGVVFKLTPPAAAQTAWS